MQFSIFKLLALTTFLGIVLVALAKLSQFTPNESEQQIAAVLTLLLTPYFSVLILFGKAKHWLLHGVFVGCSWFGMATGYLLFQSLLGGMLAGVLLGIVQSRWFRQAKSARAQFRSATSFVLTCLAMVLVCVSLTWKHRSAKSAIRNVYGRVNWEPKAAEIAGFDLDLIGRLLGPYLFPGRTSVSLRDVRSEHGSRQYTDQDLLGLRSHLESIHGLDSVTIRCREVGDLGVAQLANITWLERVVLIDTRTTSDGIAKLKRLTNLVLLDLSGSDVDDELIGTLETFPRLRFIFVGGTRITDAGIIKLSDLDLPLLYQVDVPDHISSSVVEDLKKRVTIVQQNK